MHHSRVVGMQALTATQLQVLPAAQPTLPLARPLTSTMPLALPQTPCVHVHQADSEEGKPWVGLCVLSYLCAVEHNHDEQNYDFCASAWDEELAQCEFASATGCHADYNTDAGKSQCWTCKSRFQEGELRITHHEHGTRHHLDCFWPPMGTISTRYAKQIKLQLEKCPLKPIDQQLVCARLDRMVNNHNQHMWAMM